MNQAPTGGGGAAKINRAINQITNAERLIASLPRQYDRDKVREIAQQLAQTANKIQRELTRKDNEQ